jgi:hypothetical protein
VLATTKLCAAGADVEAEKNHGTAASRGGGGGGGGVGFGCVVYFALPFIHFTPGSLRDSVPLFPKRQCK